jgi:hypothetical protein
MSRPSETHLRIAKEIDKGHRDKMLIAGTAVFEEDTFVFRGSNATEEGVYFMKDLDDKRFWHRDSQQNDFFRALLRKGRGDEVLQIAFFSLKRLEDCQPVGKISKRTALGGYCEGELVRRLCPWRQ